MMNGIFEGLKETITVAIELGGEIISLSAGNVEGYSIGDENGTIFYNGNEITIPKSFKYTEEPGDVSEFCHIFYNDVMKIYIESF